MRKVIIVCFMVVTSLNQSFFCMRDEGGSPSSAQDNTAGGLEGLVTALRRLNEKPKEEYRALQSLRAAFIRFVRLHLTWAKVVELRTQMPCSGNWDILERIMHVGTYTDEEKKAIRKNVKEIQSLVECLDKDFDNFNPQEVYVLFGMIDSEE